MHRVKRVNYLPSGYLEYYSPAAAALWTPALPTGGGQLPHTWLHTGAGLWQDVAKTVPAVGDGDLVYTWTNQGSDVSDFVQANAGSRPTLKTPILNGTPVLRYDGGDWLQGAFTGALSQPFTYLIAAQLAAGAVNDGNRRMLINDDIVRI